MGKKLMLNFTGLVLLLLLLSACSGGSGGNAAEGAASYPEESIELYVPYDPGGQSDLSARVVADHIKEYLGQDVVVINQSSGNGAVALDTVYNADSAGYKLFYGHQAMYTGYAIDQLDQDPTELTAVSTFTTVPQAYVVSADAPWNSLEEFVAEAKQNPGSLRYGADIGGTTHFMGGMLMDAAEIDIKMVDAGGESERMAALLGNQVDMVVTSVGNALTYVESGDYKVLAVLSEEREPSAPDFPTAAEQGFDIEFSIVQTVFGPPDMSEEAVKAWNDATEQLADDEEFQVALENIQQLPLQKNAEETTEFVKSQFDYIQELAKKLGY